jgi:hypothetical protein
MPWRSLLFAIMRTRAITQFPAPRVCWSLSVWFSE